MKQVTAVITRSGIYREVNGVWLGAWQLSDGNPFAQADIRIVNETSDFWFEFHKTQFEARLQLQQARRSWFAPAVVII